MNKNLKILGLIIIVIVVIILFFILYSYLPKIFDKKINIPKSLDIFSKDTKIGEMDLGIKDWHYPDKYITCADAPRSEILKFIKANSSNEILVDTTDNLKLSFEKMPKEIRNQEMKQIQIDILDENADLEDLIIGDIYENYYNLDISNLEKNKVHYVYLLLRDTYGNNYYTFKFIIK